MSEAIRFSHVYFSYEQNKDVVEASNAQSMMFHLL